MPKCPVCGEELVEVGFPRDFFQEYSCPNGCNFKMPLSWKIKEYARMTVFMMFVVCFLLLAGVKCISDKIRGFNK